MSGETGSVTMSVAHEVKTLLGLLRYDRCERRKNELLGTMPHGLPVNRRERFYTGTVFPALVCADDFAHFHRFLTLLNIGDTQVDVRRDDVNVFRVASFGVV
jgi:hypothetical protein